MPAPAAQNGVSSPSRITLDSDLFAVRHGLARLLRMQPLCDLGEEARGTAEIVLAEVLNNIVEHAYADQPGEIRVEVMQGDAGIRCQIRDRGRPMPGGMPPLGHLKPLAEGDDLPEGGFGWFLIRALVQDLTYDRDGGENILSFRLDAS